MNFGVQIKNLRKERKLTQEQMAGQLGVSRQAVSNWENDRNLPDIEMLILMSQTFHISLDELILGGDEMNNMTEKLIHDGSEGRRAKQNLVSIVIGVILLFMGIVCIAVKAMTGSYVDADGFLHENFYLLPMAFVFFFGGFVTFCVTGLRNAAASLKEQTEAGKQQRRIYIRISAGVVSILAAGFLMLLEANSGVHTASAGVVLLIIGIVDFVMAAVSGTRRK